LPDKADTKLKASDCYSHLFFRKHSVVHASRLRSVQHTYRVAQKKVSCYHSTTAYFFEPPCICQQLSKIHSHQHSQQVTVFRLYKVESLQ